MVKANSKQSTKQVAKLNSNKNLYESSVPLLLFILIVLVWFSLGYTFDQQLGINDIVIHHLTTMRGAHQAFPFFQPLYDWLWMGGQLVAGIDGNIPMERIFCLLGMRTELAASLTFFMIQWGVGYYSLDLIAEKCGLHKTHQMIDQLLLGILMAFLPIFTIRIVYGHLVFALPVFLSVFIFWLLKKDKFHYWQLVLGFLLAMNVFSTSVQQSVFYMAILLLPCLYFFFKGKRFLALLPFFSFCFFANFDYAVTFLQMLFQGDASRGVQVQSHMIYSYAHLTFKEIPDLLFYKILNIGDLNFYLLHETKALIGFVGLALFIKILMTKGFHKIFVILFSCFIFLFIFAPSPFDEIFNAIPLLNSFRIPQRSLLLFVPIIMLEFFIVFFGDHKLKEHKGNLKLEIGILSILVLLLLFQEVLIYDILLIVFLILLLFPFPFLKEKYTPSVKTLALTLASCHILYLTQFPNLFTPLESLDKTLKNSLQDEEALKRDQVLNSPEFAINTNRMINKNSIFGYTHAIASYKELYQAVLLGTQDDGQVYYAPVRTPNSMDNMITLYRYGESPLSYFTSSVEYAQKSQKDIYYKKMISETPPDFKKNMMSKTFIYSRDDKGMDLSDCPINASITKEYWSSKTSRLYLDISNKGLKDCFLVVPFNYTPFIKILKGSEGSPDGKILNANASQMGFWVKPGNWSFELGTRDLIYWFLKLLGFSLAFAIIFWIRKCKDFESRWQHSK